MQLRILSQENLKQILKMPDAIDAMRTAFSELAAGQAEMPLRTPIKVPAEKGLALFMPAFLPEQDQLGIKIAAVFPDNLQRNLPAIHAAILLLDTQTGRPKALLEGSYLTALRTGAVSGLATELFAKKDATKLAVLGAGVQAHMQLQAVLCVRDIKEVAVYSRSPQNQRQFVEAIKTQYPALQVHAAESIDAACAEADVICAATNSKEPLVYAGDVKADCHINAIGSHAPDMHEIDISILAQAKVIVDQKKACMAESGEIIRALKEAALKEEDLIELGDMVNNPAAVSPFKEQLTVFKSVGLAVQDLTSATKALNIAEEKNIGVIVDF